MMDVDTDASVFEDFSLVYMWEDPDWLLFPPSLTLTST